MTGKCDGWQHLLIATGLVTGGMGLGIAAGVGGDVGAFIVGLPSAKIYLAAVDALEERPALRAKLGRLFGLAGEAVADQALRDAAEKPNTGGDLHYLAVPSYDGWHATAVSDPGHGFDAFTHARVSADLSRATLTRKVDGKLDCRGTGAPSAAAINDSGQIQGAVWHIRGQPVQMWSPKEDAVQPLILDIEPRALADECWGMIDDLNTLPPSDAVEAALDLLCGIASRADDLADCDVDVVAVKLDGGRLTLAALDRDVSAALAERTADAAPVFEPLMSAR